MRTQPPARSAEDLATASRKAISARARYADAKHQLKWHERSLKSVLDDDTLQRMRVRDVIAALPGMGKIRADKVMEDIGISKTRRIAGLGARQYSALLERFRNA